MAEPVLYDASEIDYVEYVDHQKDSYRDLLSQTKSNDSFMTPAYYRWQYNTPYGTAKIAAVMDGKRYVASNAMFPMYVRQGKTRIKAWQSLDTATRPSHRGKGYFVSCLNTLKKALGSDEIFFGFPNKNSVKGFIKIGWTENLVVTTWINPLAIPSGFPANVNEVEVFDSRQDALVERLASIAESPMIEHGSAYLNWRYSGHPNNKYGQFVYESNDTYRGFGVVRQAEIMGRNIGLVMEIWGENSGIRRAIMSRLARWTVDHDLHMTALLSSNFGQWESMLSGFVLIPSIVLPKRQVLAMMSTGEESGRIASMEWQVQTGDWDVF